MRQEVYSCDVCKKPNAKEHLSRMTVKAEGIHFNDLRYSRLQIDICDECLKKKGFVVERKPEDDNERCKQNDRTLESKIIDILVDLGVVFVE